MTGDTIATQAPFPYFGGKSKIASLVWEALGSPSHYIEPFFGSGAVLLARPSHDPAKMTETVNDKDGFLCLAPSTKVLNEKLNWIEIGNCKIGDKLLAFDEKNTGPRFKKAPSGYRHWRIANVTKVHRAHLPSFRLSFNDGTKIICSENHQWLGAKNRGLRWLTTKNWKYVISREKQKAWVLKILSTTNKENTYEAGWLGGFADGEGHYHGSAHKGGGSWAISLHQAKGPIIEYARKLLVDRGFSIRSEIRNKKKFNYKDMVSLHINGGMAETFRFLMATRPERLIRNLLLGIEKKSIYTRKKRYVYVEKMEFIGVQEVVALETDTHTYIAEGLASHNCNVWRAIQFSPGETARWCDWPVNHADLSARRKTLIKNEDRLLENLINNDTWHDPVLAGYWIWAASCWIGGGLTKIGSIPNINGGGEGIHKIGRRPDIGKGGEGVHKISKRPHLGSRGEGVHKIGILNENIYVWFKKLSERLRYVRVVCGDWTRVCGGNWQDKMGDVGIFFDPPYGDKAQRTSDIYAQDSLTVASEVQQWCAERGKSSSYRIVLAGYYEEHADLLSKGWTAKKWVAGGGYSSLGKSAIAANGFKEALFFSPYCLKNELF